MRHASSTNAGMRFGSRRRRSWRSGRSARMRTPVPVRLVVDSPPAATSRKKMANASSSASSPVLDCLRADPEQRARVMLRGGALLNERIDDRTHVHHRSAEFVEAFVGYEPADRFD